VDPVEYGNIPRGHANWSPKIHQVGSDRPPTWRVAAPQLGMVVHNNVMYVATYCHELGHTFGMRGSREVRNIPWINDGWSPKIHKVGYDRSPTARETVPHLCMIVRINGMYVATHCHE
jgi:hypothetical protein